MFVEISSIAICNWEIQEFLGKEGLIKELKGITDFNVNPNKIDVLKSRDANCIMFHTETALTYFVITANNLAACFGIDVKVADAAIAKVIKDNSYDDFLEMTERLKNYMNVK